MNKIFKLIIITSMLLCLSSCSNEDSINIINKQNAKNYIIEHEVKTYNYLDYFNWIEHSWEDVNPNTNELYYGTQKFLYIKDGYYTLSNFDNTVVTFNCSYSVKHDAYYDSGNSSSTSFNGDKLFSYKLPNDNNINLKGKKYIEDTVNLPLVTTHGSITDKYTFDSVEITYANGLVFEINIPDEYWYESSESIQGISAHNLGKYFIYNNNGNFQRIYDGGYVANLLDQTDTEIDNIFNVYDNYSISVYQYFIEEVLNS